MESGKAFIFYIIYSATLDKYYYGQTGDEISNRLRKHNSNHNGFSGVANDWEVVYTELFDTKLGALKRERQVKGWKSRSRVERLIKVRV